MRRDQPICKNCRHPKSFHSGGKTRCKALGCSCKQWRVNAPSKTDKK